MSLLTIAACALILCVSFPANASDGRIIEHGPRETKKIALTFDACPTGKSEEYDEEVIQVLIKEKIPATLFVSGRWAERHPEITRFLSDLPQFEIANHSYTHPHMLQAGDDRGIREVLRTQAMIRKITGKAPRYFRPPYGEVNEHVAGLVSQAGLVTIQFDIASGDPDPGLSSERIVRSILRSAKGGSIIVFHMNRNGVRTAQFLPVLIQGLRKKGFVFTTVGGMLEDASDRVIQVEDSGRKSATPLLLGVPVHPAPLQDYPPERPRLNVSSHMIWLRSSLMTSSTISFSRTIERSSKK